MQSLLDKVFVSLMDLVRRYLNDKFFSDLKKATLNDIGLFMFIQILTTMKVFFDIYCRKQNR